MSQVKILSLRMGFHEWLDTHRSLPLTSNKKQFTPSRFWGHSFWIKSVRGKRKNWHVRAGSTVLGYAARKRGKRDQVWVVRNSNLQASGERAVHLKRRNGVLDSSITRREWLPIVHCRDHCTNNPLLSSYTTLMTYSAVHHTIFLAAFSKIWERALLDREIWVDEGSREASGIGRISRPKSILNPMRDIFRRSEEEPQTNKKRLKRTIELRSKLFGQTHEYYRVNRGSRAVVTSDAKRSSSLLTYHQEISLTLLPKSYFFQCCTSWMSLTPVRLLSRTQRSRDTRLKLVVTKGQSCSQIERLIVILGDLSTISVVWHSSHTTHSISGCGDHSPSAGNNAGFAARSI